MALDASAVSSYARAYQLMAEHFAACVRGQASLRYTPAEAAANMRVIAALYRSARNGGRPEPVASPE